MPRVGELVQSTEAAGMRGHQHGAATAQLGLGRMMVGNQPCASGGHITWRCNECGDTTYAPPLGSACRVLHGPAGSRNL